MKVTFLFRHEGIGFSIHNVFNTVKGELMKCEYNVEVDSVTCPSDRSMPWDTLINSFYVRKKSKDDNIHHITGHIHDVVIGLFRRKVVLTIHDLVFIDNVRNPIKRFYKWLLWLYIPVKLADKVTCISQTTKDNVNRYIKSDKIKVVHNPISPAFEFVKKSFDKEKPVILHVGTGWNKNLKNTIEALDGISCHLRIIGKIKKEIFDLLTSSNIDYSWVHNLSDDEIRMEYMKCDIVSFPSIYEGFGMPIIEGQKTGRPVITSSIEPLIEISGNAVHFVDPYDILSIREGFKKVIQDEAYRQKLIIDGSRNAVRFEAGFIAQQYLEIYNSI